MMIERGKVLIVDDERFNLRVLVELLRTDCDTMVAKTGEQALQSARSSLPPDLILLDIMMPEMDGYQVCRHLKADEATRHIPIIFVTAMQSEEDETKGFELGAVDYITKPISPPIVRARVKTHLKVVMAQNKIRLLNRDLAHALTEQKRSYEALKETQVELAETKAMALMTRVFEKFVPKQFLNRIAKDGLENIKLGTVELNTITILFNDIRSFTTLAESMSPEDVFSFLNEYFRKIQVPIERHGGFIDKFIGDATMALFDGPPEVQATHGVRAAIDMQKHLMTYNEERAIRGEHPIRTGIGLHTGPVMLGTIGHENRMDSTVIGDAVNLAARMESLTKFYDCRIIISEDLLRLLGAHAFLYRTLDRVVVKGRKQPIVIHEIFESDPEPERTRKQALLETFHQGVSLFQTRCWRESREMFLACLEKNANDHMSRIYTERCTVFMASPPQTTGTAPLKCSTNKHSLHTQPTWMITPDQHGGSHPANMEDHTRPTWRITPGQHGCAA